MSNNGNGFAVVDVETTGFGSGDRVIEIGIVLLDHRLRIVDEYETLIDPERDLGPTHVHGITPKMISMAPSFGEVASAIAKRIGDRVIVAHNLIFDERMLGQEFGRLRAIFDPGVGICTLKLTKQKLPAACQMLGVDPPSHHRALADARASAGLLRALKPKCNGQPLKLGNVPGEISVRTHRRCADEGTLVLDRLISRVVYTEGDTRLLQYMDLLDWVLDDFVLTADERQHLNFLAEELSLSEAEIVRAHEQYFDAMVVGAKKDGIITQEENAALAFVANALGIPIDRVPAVTEPDCGCSSIPVGSSICFTGSFADSNGNKLPKAELEKLATNRGFTVVSNVTKSKCDVVVAVDPSSSSGKAKKAREFGKPVIASQDFLKQVQN
ncbi:exonuclease domain-containing protein [Roseiconus lacunae]|uniref:Exonuclease domain-containing protein n=2 Tax=Roseiconus lacunae TaxID=2605694 RepID=A0ABT7PFG3_9BACT|nr:exonuclease domain-containing protein [Roseiconus lacunae]MDM4015113.1 exonuclease domain-containing protein [Roseiconus lacunae]